MQGGDDAPWTLVASTTAFHGSATTGLSSSATTSSSSSDRIHVRVLGRFVTILRRGSAQGKQLYFCVDSTCYHAGGPLGLGDIEDVNGVLCIKCPWHAYPVALEDGSKLYQALEFDKETKKMSSSGWKKKEHAQRVHQVEERANGEIWVKLNTSKQVYDSDEYAGSVVCGERVAAGDAIGAKKGKDGILSSGTLLSEQRWKQAKVTSMQRDGDHGIRLTLQVPGKLFSPQSKPLLMMNAAELFAHPFIIIRIGSIERFYTPLPASGNEDSVTLGIRVYRDGLVSSSLSRLSVGDTVSVRKPGELDPHAAQTQRVEGFLPQKLKSVILVAAGSGITPLLQVSASVIENTPQAKVTLICLDHSEQSILCRDITSAFVHKNEKRVRLIRILSEKNPVHSRLAGESVCIPGGEHTTLVATLQAQGISYDAKRQQQDDVEDRVLISWAGPAGFCESMPSVCNHLGFQDTRNALFVPFIG